MVCIKGMMNISSATARGIVRTKGGGDMPIDHDEWWHNRNIQEWLVMPKRIASLEQEWRLAVSAPPLTASSEAFCRLSRFGKSAKDRLRYEEMGRKPH